MRRSSVLACIEHDRPACVTHWMKSSREQHNSAFLLKYVSCCARSVFSRTAICNSSTQRLQSGDTLPQHVGSFKNSLRKAVSFVHKNRMSARAPPICCCSNFCPSVGRHRLIHASMHIMPVWYAWQCASNSFLFLGRPTGVRGIRSTHTFKSAASQFSVSSSCAPPPPAINRPLNIKTIIMTE